MLHFSDNYKRLGEVLGNDSTYFNDTLEEQDPEVTPGLFQGDMALTNEVYNYWRVGLNWEVFPNRLWKNGIVPYVISPLYGKIFKLLKESILII